jgi:hypothetical protein
MAFLLVRRDNVAMSLLRRFFVSHLCIGLSSLVLLSACAGISKPLSMKPQDQAEEQQTPSASASEAIWQPMHLPNKRKTIYAHGKHDGRQAIKATANRSASMFRQQLRIPASDLSTLQFSWAVPMLIEQADMAVRETEDAPVRVILSFEGDRSKFSAKNKMLSDLSHALTGEELPYATLMYVWCTQCPVGSLITNPRTDRIRKLAVESGRGHLNQWRDYERDIRTDFLTAFGEEPGALTGIALMTDTDNTQTQATAWYGPVRLTSKKLAPTAIAKTP